MMHIDDKNCSSYSKIIRSLYFFFIYSSYYYYSLLLLDLIIFFQRNKSSERQNPRRMPTTWLSLNSKTLQVEDTMTFVLVKINCTVSWGARFKSLVEYITEFQISIEPETPQLRIRCHSTAQLYCFSFNCQYIWLVKSPSLITHERRQNGVGLFLFSLTFFLSPVLLLAMRRLEILIILWTTKF